MGIGIGVGSGVSTTDVPVPVVVPLVGGLGQLPVVDVEGLGPTVSEPGGAGTAGLPPTTRSAVTVSGNPSGFATNTILNVPVCGNTKLARYRSGLSARASICLPFSSPGPVIVKWAFLSASFGSPVTFATSVTGWLGCTTSSPRASVAVYFPAPPSVTSPDVFGSLASVASTSAISSRMPLSFGANLSASLRSASAPT
ncbi:MAG: hypothetical protein IPJ34_25270 [Myxococcales bacterium]|nr:hypothetical protein [Myxococcales bacterium]